MPLLIANFDQQSIVSRDDVLTAVRRLPRLHYAALDVIRYDPKRQIATTLSYLFEESTPIQANGLYYQERDTAVVILFFFNSRQSFLHVLYHEIGHHVFLRVLSQAQRDAWFYQVRPAEPAAISHRAQRNAREDFAECYAAWCLESPLLPKLPVRFNFFANSVFPLPNS